MQTAINRQRSILDRYSVKLARDHPFIWATRLDIVIIYCLIMSPISVLFMEIWQPTFGYSNYQIELIVKTQNAFLIFSLLSFLVSLYWGFSILNQIRIPYGPKLRYIPWSATAHFCILLLCIPVIIPFSHGVERYMDLSEGYSSFSDGNYFILWLLSGASFISVAAISMRKFGFQAVMIGIFTSIMLSAIIFFCR